MAQDLTEKLLFEVRLDAEQLKAQQSAVRTQQQQLTVDIAETRKMQKLLEADYKSGSVTAGEYGKEAQRLSEKLRSQTKEQALASKQLDSLTKVQDTAAGSIDQLRAELTLTTAAYNALGVAERSSTEEGKALQARTRAISDELKGLESAVGNNSRNVGNYSGSLKDLVKEMVKLQAQEKNLTQGSKELAENQQRQIGFQTAAQTAAAKAGKSYEEAQKDISNYAKAIRPAVEQLVSLEAEQARVVETSGEASEAYAQIGFKLAAANKAVEDAEPAAQGFGGALLDAAKNSNTLGGTVGQVTGLQERFTQAQGLAKLALGGTATASSVLRVAMLAIPLVAIVAGLAALFSFLTKTQAGAEFVTKKMAFLNGVFTVGSRIVTDFGEKIFRAAEDPKQAFSDLVDFIGTNLLNRLKSFGVILDAIRNRDVSKLQDGFIQLGTGVTDGTAKLKAFGGALAEAGREAERLAVLQKELDRATDDNIDTNKRLLNEVERLKNVRDNEFNTLAVRRQANEAAFKVEQERERTLADLARRRVEVLAGQIALEGGRNKVSRERFQELKEAENELADIQEDAAGKQNELITNRFQLAKEGEDKLKELAEAADAATGKRLQDRIGLQQAQIDAQLATVVQGSEAELSLLKDKLARQRELELADKKLSADQRKALEVKYRADVEALDRDHLQTLREQAAESQQTAIAAQLARAREGSQEEFLLQAQAIQASLQQQLAGIGRRQSAEAQAAQEDRIRAETAKVQADLEFAQALASLETYLAQQRTLTNQQFADGTLTKAQHEANLAAIEAAGQQARLVTQQDYGRDTVATQEAISAGTVAAVEKEAAVKRGIAEAEIAIKEFYVQAATDAADTVIAVLGEETAAGQAALAVKKVLAIAEIGIGLQKQLAANSVAAATISALAPPATIPLGIAYKIASNVASVAAAALATAKVLAFADGGLVSGPGGPKDDKILARLSNGEAVMTADAVRRFGPLLSMLNVAGGGRSFYTDPMSTSGLALAQGGVVRYDPYVMDPMVSGRSGGASPINYRELAQAIAEEVVPGFYGATRSLPVPVVELSELATQQQKVSLNESRRTI